MTSALYTAPTAGWKVTPAHPQCPKLYPRYTTTNETYAHGLYHEILAEDEVQAFLEEMGSSYSNEKKRWAIPESPPNRECLVDALYSVLRSIFERFVKPSEPEVERHIFNIQDYPQFEKKDKNGYAICPVLVVPAVGPSFDLPPALHSVPSAQLAVVNLGYSCMATYFTVKLDSNQGTVEEQVDEMETYARYGRPQCTIACRLSFVQADSA